MSILLIAHLCGRGNGLNSSAQADDRLTSPQGAILIAGVSNEQVTDAHSALSNPHSTIVLGLGNSLRGDDGVGPAVIEWLERQALPDDVEAIDGGTAGLDIVSTLMGHERAIIVDAANIDRSPGEWMRFTPDVAQLEGNDTTLSLHSAGLAEALALGAALKALPPTIIIYGVQPQNLDWSAQLSAVVQAAVAEVGQAILQELK